MSKEEENVLKDKKRKIIVICIIIASILLITITCCTIFALMNSNNNKIIEGIKINEFNVSNMTKEEAKEKLSAVIENKKKEKISIKEEEFESEISIEELEVNYNIDKAIETAYLIGRNGNIIHNNFEILDVRKNSKDIDIEIEYNHDNLNKIIDEINGKIPNAKKENSYYIEEKNLIITKGVKGNIINKEELVKKIEENISNITENTNEIEMPTEEKDVEDIDIEKIYSEIHSEAKDAYYTKDPFTIYPHVNGVDFGITMEEAKALLQEEKQEYIIPLKITVPETTTDKIGSEAFPDMLSSFTTRYDGGNIARTTNLKVAAQKINGTVLMPGETFSYNNTLGRRSIETGYKEAAVFQGGKVVDGIGGGICQISSTLYNTAVMANMEIVARTNHGFLTSYIGAGKDATVVYGAIDFKFKNTRKYPVKIIASVNNGIAKMEMYGVKEETEYKIDIQATVTETIPFTVTYIDDPELPVGKEVVEQKGQNGCKSIAYKVMSLNGAVVSRKVLSTDKYDAMERIIRRGVEPAVETTQQQEENEQTKEVVKEPEESEKTTSIVEEKSEIE